MFELTSWIAGTLGGFIALGIYLLVYSGIYALAHLWELKYGIKDEDL